MRVRRNAGDLSAHAIAGTYVVLLGTDVADESSALDGLLGFAVHRTNHTEGKEGWLPGFKTFESLDRAPHPARLTSTRDNPLQGFLWGDYGAKAGQRYTYRVVPMYGKAGALREGRAVDVTVSTENESEGTHAVYFNRGAAASQAYERKFKNKPPDEVPDRAAYVWLSRGLEEALTAFIRQAKDRRWGLRAAVYEFSYEPVLAEFKAAAERGADVQIIYDFKRGALKPGAHNLKEIRKAGLEEVCIPRAANNSYIAHNKFIVLLKNDKPVEVWTGSTNVTEGGIFGHSNLGHLVRDPRVATAYLEYWKTLSDDPKAPQLREWTDENTPMPRPRSRSRMIPIFSPRSSLEALEFYANLMDGARSSVFFTAAFGVNRLFRKVLATNKPYLRYLLLEKEDKDDEDDPDIEIYKRDRENLVAIGSHLTDNVLEKWVMRNFAREDLTGLNKHVKYIHTKYMLVDPLSDDPTVVSGSANFSSASTRNNDENMLIIRGDTRVADIYLGEFMRLYHHYRFRAFANQASDSGETPKKLYLSEDDSWLRPYYASGTVKMQERKLFA